MPLRVHVALFHLTLVALCAVSPAAAQPGRLPDIISGSTNAVPACVTPDRLMQFVYARNRALMPGRKTDRRFSNIADVYRSVGECVQKSAGKCIGVRWDYAFFQMLVETNYLIFTGAVRAEHNNFAGIGATIAGRPGERFASVEDGVRAHLQHVLMYAGVAIEHPVTRRTGTVQAEVRQRMQRLSRPVTFTDLAAVWTGTDQSTYAASIERTQNRFADAFCRS